MGWLTRLGMFAAGLFLICMAVAQLRSGHFVFDNASYHQTTFAAGGIGVGIGILLLAFLPPNNWVYKHITTRRENRRMTARRRNRS
jgi:hypothetical protein